ncbi:beta-sandwich domain-containing protein [Bdellovibrio bacteriovorus]|uniref:Bdellovibrio beta-sandwich domain-containing protein n=1 Tax=Bdellovibrio bacteriovorus str. Tiberius TaxID=1069642 RepID=K7Z8D1_BDEBC|nr:beta-sandwich domain-containing protein [Bdellovibrio bacteriovorus]AFY00689.1 hypothetical protein Bdt_0989 [Bdellovibrio bacteriovorus str. Tiberius]
MKKKLVLGMLAAAAVMQATSPAMAQYNDNRPGRYPEAPMPPPPPGQYLQEGTLEIQGISRKSGGEYYRISLRRAVSLERIEVAALAMRLKIHDASVITEDGQRVSIREFRNTAVFGVGSRAVSENLNLRSRIVAIDILAESYGGYADVRVTALSTDERPQLVLGNLQPERPQRPDRPNRPERPDRPGNGGGHGGGNNVCARRADVTQLLAQLDADMETYSRTKNSASYGSPVYNMAERELQATAAKMIEVANSREGKETALEKLEILGALYFKKMNQSSYGSTQYNAYSAVGTAMFNAMEKGLEVTMACDLRSTQELLAKADEMSRKMNQQSYGSVAYNAYMGLSKKLYSEAPGFFEKEAYQNRRTYVDMNTDLEAFFAKGVSYSYGSVAYNSYQELVQKASLVAQASLRASLPGMRPLERIELVKQFDSRKNRFSYGSVIYNHYEAMRDISSK